MEVLRFAQHFKNIRQALDNRPTTVVTIIRNYVMSSAYPSTYKQYYCECFTPPPTTTYKILGVGYVDLKRYGNMFPTIFSDVWEKKYLLARGGI